MDKNDITGPSQDKPTAPDPGLLHIGKILKANRYFPPHAHQVWEIVLYTHGKGRATVGTVATDFTPGTIICMPPGLLQEERSQAGYRNIHLLISHFESWGPVPVIHADANHPIYRVAELLYEAFNLSGAGADAPVEHLFGAFMHYLYQWRSGDAHDAIIRRLQKTIIDNLHDADFNIAGLFKSLPFSLDHGRRIFVKKTGRTPVQFLISSRMLKARELLMQGKSVKETAIAVGLPNQAYFSRLFSKICGMGPKVFKRGKNVFA